MKCASHEASQTTWSNHQRRKILNDWLHAIAFKYTIQYIWRLPKICNNSWGAQEAALYIIAENYFFMEDKNECKFYFLHSTTEMTFKERYNVRIETLKPDWHKTNTFRHYNERKWECLWAHLENRDLLLLILWLMESVSL